MLIEVSAAAVVHLSGLVLPQMLRRGVGYIVNVGSIAAHLPVPGIAVYSATKAFVESFTTARHREMRGNPVRITIVHPGPVRTEFFAAAAERSGRCSFTSAPRQGSAVKRSAAPRRIPFSSTDRGRSS
jgi:short-subunit dehydrogenase